MKEEALKLADELDALHQYVPSEAPAMIRRLVEELDEQGQPVAWALTDKRNEYVRSIMTVQHDFVPDGCIEIPLYTKPQTKPLSDEEIEGAFYKKCWYYDEDEKFDYYGFAREIEERHGIK